MDKNFEIIVYGRGGEGTKTLGQIIAQACVKENLFVQAYPEYGPERRGAPVRAFIKISNKPIRNHSSIKNPNLVILFSKDLADVFSEIKDFDCKIIINSAKDKKSKTNLKDFKSKEIYEIDASSIALEELKINNPNIVLVGVFIKIFKDIKYKTIEEIISEEFSKKAKSNYIKPNLNCLKKGFEYF
ncbi:MAG: 2-oxoacid:acceptor oxidoreductase family protein [archaeon]